MDGVAADCEALAEAVVFLKYFRDRPDPRQCGKVRACAVCYAHQVKAGGEWSPPVSLICRGDPDDGGRAATRRRPDAPCDAPRVRTLEDA
jgi:hypothetical protein